METSSLKRIANKYTQTSLILRILIGMAIGVVLALTVPEFTGIKILGDLCRSIKGNRSFTCMSFNYEFFSSDKRRT